jgi:DNA-binding MarR family transcriptional regulator
MSTETTAKQFMDLFHRYLNLHIKLELPEDVAIFRKKMAALRGASHTFEDKAFLYRIFMLLSQNEEPLTMGRLSCELSVPLSTATRIVDGLAQAGMVERVNDPSDRRVVRVGMSKNGHELYKAAMAYNKQRIAKLLNIFTADEQEQLLKLMNKLFDAFINVPKNN